MLINLAVTARRSFYRPLIRGSHGFPSAQPRSSVAGSERWFLKDNHDVDLPVMKSCLFLLDQKIVRRTCFKPKARTSLLSKKLCALSVVSNLFFDTLLIASACSLKVSILFPNKWPSKWIQPLKPKTNSADFLNWRLKGLKWAWHSL